MDEQEISLQELWQTIVSHAGLIAGITIVAMVAAFVASSLMTPIYEAETTFLINSAASNYSLTLFTEDLAGRPNSLPPIIYCFFYDSGKYIRKKKP